MSGLVKYCLEIDPKGLFAEYKLFGFDRLAGI
jgi:hypothetical protein